jgi:anti-sigma regulatory factor (Ser/Thr protein kinase)
MISKEIKNRTDIVQISAFLKNIDNRLVIIFREAGLNILKHTKKGVFSFIDLKNRYQLVFDDISNGLNIKKAFIKGFSKTKTLGIGLNVLLNISDEVEIIPKTNGTKFIFTIYKEEKKEFCLFNKNYENISAFMKTSPFLTISTSGDCGIFEKIKDKYLFALWDIEGHGNKEVYEASKELKKLILTFKYYPLSESLEIINYLFSKRASMIIGEITDNIKLFQFGNVNFITENQKSNSAMGIFGMKILGIKEYNLSLQDITLFSDGINLYNNKIYSYEELEKILKNKNNDDASLMVIKVKNGNYL